MKDYGWNRAINATNARVKTDDSTLGAAVSETPEEDADKIRSICKIACVPEKADGYIANGSTFAEVLDELETRKRISQLNGTDAGTA